MPKLPKLHPSVQVNQKPKISATALAEYLVLKPHHHDNILHDNKFVTPPIVLANRDALTALKAYNTDPNRKDSILDASRANLAVKAKDPALTPKQKDEALRCIDIIDLFERRENTLGIAGMSLKKMPKVRSVKIKDVRVSIKPDYFVDIMGPRGGRKTGVGIIRVAKSPNPEDCVKEITRKNREEHRRELAYYLITLFEIMCKANPDAFENYNRSACFVADVRLGETLRAQSDFHTRLKAVEAACGHISRLWDTVEPKPAICA